MHTDSAEREWACSIENAQLSSKVSELFLSFFFLAFFLISFGVSFFLIADSIRGFVCPSVGPSMVIESKSGKTSVLDTFCVCLTVGGGLGCGWGLDAPAHPSATILWPRVTCLPSYAPEGLGFRAILWISLFFCKNHFSVYFVFLLQYLQRRNFLLDIH